MQGDERDVLARIADTDLVLDVGGWACPFNRADWILDAEPYATRGYYASIGMPASQGGDKERFSSATWVQRDICSREPWPFTDKQFDFSICSHTLEDVRDPLGVCEELIRVSKAGYIEVPSRLLETCRGQEHPRMAGLSHHRWLVEAVGNHLQFTPKYGLMHVDFDLSLPAAFARRIAPAQTIVRFFWAGRFTFAETTIHGADRVRTELAEYVRRHYRYPRSLYIARGMAHWARRARRRLLG